MSKALVGTTKPDQCKVMNQAHTGSAKRVELKAIQGGSMKHQPAIDRREAVMQAIKRTG